MRWGRAEGQTWSDYVRQVLSFALGLAVVIDMVFVRAGVNVGGLVVGLLLMGVVPVDAVFARMSRGGDK